MKRFIAVFFAFWICLNFYATDLQVVDTKYFQIIYDAEVSSKSAALLAEYADTYATDIFTRLEVKPFKDKMPVYFKPAIENLNGYYAMSPYPHIVIFDTTPTDGMLGNQTDVLLKVFYHEFTHAVSIRLSAILAPLAMREGVTVSFESLEKEGRLNDPRIIHQFTQNRIDGTSPSWSDASDFRDTYPAGFWGYVYGGAFSKFLQDVYGMKKYAEIWNGTMKSFSRASFKKHFGKKLTTAWDDFIMTIPFPKNVSPEKTLFEKKDYTSIYTSMASSIKGFAISDANKDKIIVFNNNKEKLFSIRTAPLVYAMSFSQDGNLLAISDFADNKGTEKSRVLLYDLIKRKFLPEKYFSLRYACFSNDSSSICGVEVNSQFSNLVLINRNTDEKKVLFEAGPGLPYTALYNVVNAGKEGFAFITANGINRDILFINPKTMKIKKLELTQKMQAISNLQSNTINGQTLLTFSWTNTASLCKMATYNIDTQEFRILKKEVSGGTFYPVAYNNSQNPKELFAVVGIHATYHKLCKINSDELEKDSVKLIDFTNTDKPKSKRPNLEILKPKKYNPIMKMWVPSVSPYFLPAPSFTDFAKHIYGLTFTSADPIERLSYSFSGGIMPKPFFVNFDFQGAVSVGKTKTTLSVREQFIHGKNHDIHKTGFGLGNEAEVFEGTRQNSLKIKTNVNFDWFALCKKDMKNIYKQKHTETVIGFDFDIEYADIVRKVRLGYPVFAEDIHGFKIATNHAFAHHLQNKKSGYQVQTSATFKTPEVPLTVKLSGLLAYNILFNPLRGNYALTGTPGILTVNSYMPKMNAYAKMPLSIRPDKMTGAFGLDTAIRILSVEIQKTSLWLPVCYNRFNIDTGYKSVLLFLNKAEKPSYLQAVYLNITVDISGRATIGLEYSHPLIPKVKFGTVDFIFELAL
ncbi:MAG: hypothetical protein CR988_00650 [Treponema sp.]|nr:MAG: hypothetical protein CR988_00650 [Treponema sp.]